jgi:hypothetical protein
MVVVDDIPIQATMRVDIANIQTQNRSLDKIEWGKNGKNRIIGYSEAGGSGSRWQNTQYSDGLQG